MGVHGRDVGPSERREGRARPPSQPGKPGIAGNGGAGAELRQRGSRALRSWGCMAVMWALAVIQSFG